MRFTAPVVLLLRTPCTPEFGILVFDNRRSDWRPLASPSASGCCSEWQLRDTGDIGDPGRLVWEGNRTQAHDRYWREQQEALILHNDRTYKTVVEDATQELDGRKQRLVR
jgi:hypothetical protein